MARFKHKFYKINSVEEVPKPNLDEHQYFFIVDESSTLSIKALKEHAGKYGIIVFYGKNTKNLPQDDIKNFDDIWISISSELDKFYFERMLKIIADQKDAWLQKNWLESAINSLPDMIWFKDMQGLHINVNNSFCQAVNKTKDDIRGRDHYYIWDIPKEIYENSDYVCVETEDSVIAARKTVLFDEEVMKTDGNLIKLKTYKTPIFDGDTIIGTVGIARDVTQEYEYLEKIKYLAIHDQLTGLANRNQLDIFLSKLKTSKMSIVCMDLDNFKGINDSYGHQTGDKVLVVFSNLIKEVFNDALNVRTGADEFIISIFTDSSNIKNILNRVQILIDKFSDICKKDFRFQRLSVSAGIADGKFGHGSFDILFKHADNALYKAKRKKKGGGGCYHNDKTKH
ncbi:sensor domain-containing diguanylate cyclase [Campylobacter sputorum]|uniref:sensor domain-containing diguanylate cyclase n=1 Tax=Campylobacter sputorum TaxID=206 RepID=UPI001245A9EB|nr:sensor domain-containing diguanylate cyclase [Campylobacter sputorum]KAB0582362.1 GGDEF domain-containing protein [Campylobacter sputorum subsp. sputorum]